MNILHNSSPNSSSRPATNQRNAMKRAEENASGKALDFEQELCNICICLGHLHTSYAVEGDGAKVMVRTVYTVLRALPRLLHRLHLRCTDRELPMRFGLSRSEQISSFLEDQPHLQIRGNKYQIRSQCTVLHAGVAVPNQ